MQFILALLMLVIAGTIWAIFLRPVPSYKSNGNVVAKSFRPAGHEVVYHAGDRKNFRLPVYIPRAAGYVLDITLKDQSQSMFALVNTSLGERIELGAEVEVEYQIRSVPGVWRRVYVTSVRLLEP